VTDTKVIQDVNVTVNINHTWDADLTLYLIGPDATQVMLSAAHGSSGDNYTSTVFDDEAPTAIASGTPPYTGSFRPDQVLSAFDGKIAAGTWTLRATDSTNPDAGTIIGWSITFTYPAQACGPHGKYASSANVADTCPSGGAGNDNGAWDAGETVQFSVTLENDGTVNLTGVTATLTSSTPGVSFPDGTATYANIATGATGTSQAPHFTAVLPTSLSCGGTVAFHVVITSDQGTWSGDFTHGVGTVLSGNFTLMDEDFEGTWGTYGNAPPTSSRRAERT
jgi:uncharacterized repeat protein (TIGR01451 family)